MQKRNIKILRKSALHLFIALGTAVLLSLLTILYYQYFPSYSSEGSAWGNIGDMLSINVAVFFYFIVAIIYWIVKCIWLYTEKD